MKENKKAKKVVALLLCAVLLVVGSVTGTMAYLTSQDKVVNTFTVGNVTITMDETDVDLYGVKDGETRVKANEYKLIPGHTYAKDPIVHVATGSENCYLFVEVVNDLVAIEDNNDKIADQMEQLGWTALAADSNVYYYDRIVVADNNIPVFAHFKISGDVVGGDIPTPPESGVLYLENYRENKIITVTAYAVQADGFDTAADHATDAKAAWYATFGAPANP